MKNNKYGAIQPVNMASVLDRSVMKCQKCILHVQHLFTFQITPEVVLLHLDVKETRWYVTHNR